MKLRNSFTALSIIFACFFSEVLAMESDEHKAPSQNGIPTKASTEDLDATIIQNWKELQVLNAKVEKLKRTMPGDYIPEDEIPGLSLRGLETPGAQEQAIQGFLASGNWAHPERCQALYLLSEAERNHVLEQFASDTRFVAKPRFIAAMLLPEERRQNMLNTFKQEFDVNSSWYLKADTLLSEENYIRELELMATKESAYGYMVSDAVREWAKKLRNEHLK